MTMPLGDHIRTGNWRPTEVRPGSTGAMACALMHLLARSLVLAFFLLAPAAASENGAATTVRVQLKWFHAFQFAGFYAAQEQGYFKEAGLRVELLEGGPTIDPVDAVTHGDAEFGIGNSSLLIDFNKGRPVMAVAAIFQHSPFVILARRGNGIHTVRDLAGRTLMGETHAAELQAYLKLAGVDIARVKVVPHTGTVNSLMPSDPGGIDATTAYISTEPYFAAELNIPYQVFNPRDIGIDFYGDTLFVSQAFAAARPEVVVAMRNALVKGWKYAHTHQNEIVSYILKNYLSHKHGLALVFEANAIDPLLDANFVDIGYMSVARWRNIGDMFVKAGELPADYSLQGFLFNEKPSLPSWVNPLLIGSLAALLIAFAITAYIIRQHRKLASTHKLVVERTKALEKANHQLDGYRNRLEKRVTESTADLQETLTRLEETQFAMNRAGIGIQWVDFGTGCITYVNQRMADMLGYTQAELLQLNIADINDDFDTSGHREQRQRIRQEGHLHIETVRRTKAGKTLSVEVLAYFHKGNARQPPHIIGFVTDISARKEAEQALNRAKQAAESADLAKTAFLSNMSHEMRTPLHQINGMATLIRREPLTPKQADRIDKLEVASHRLTNIVDTVLRLTSLEARKYTLVEHAVDLAVLIEKVANDTRPRAESGNLRLNVETAPLPGSLLGDAGHIEMALHHYLDNALRFTKTGDITLRIRPVEEGTASVLVRFEVEDTGMGISTEDQARLFNLFEQVDNSSTRQYGGLGAGLAITKKIANLMGGDAGCNSTPGKGSVFWFTARLKKMAAAEMQSHASN